MWPLKSELWAKVRKSWHLKTLNASYILFSCFVSHLTGAEQFTGH